MSDRNRIFIKLCNIRKKKYKKILHKIFKRIYGILINFLTMKKRWFECLIFRMRTLKKIHILNKIRGLCNLSVSKIFDKNCYHAS